MVTVAINMTPGLTFCAAQDGTVIQMRAELDGDVSVEIWPKAIKGRYSSFEQLITATCHTEPLLGHIAGPVTNLKETIAWFLLDLGLKNIGSLEVETVDNPTTEELDLFAANFVSAAPLKTFKPLQASA